MNNNIREKKTQMNQSHNTNSVIEWFKAINNKSKSSFIKFDIIEFYRLVFKEVISKAIEYAVTTIKKKITKLMYRICWSLLFDKGNVWIKKDNLEFDATMGSYDGTELCELVGLYLLDLLTKAFGKQNIGLYIDDDLSCFENLSRPDSEKTKNKLFKIFESNGVSMTVECNLIVTDFPDVTVDLKTAT